MAREAKEEEIVSALTDEDDASEAVPPMEDSASQEGDIARPAIAENPTPTKQNHRPTLHIPPGNELAEEVSFASSPTPPVTASPDPAEVPPVFAPPPTPPVNEPMPPAVASAPAPANVNPINAAPVANPSHVGDPSKIRFQLFEANVIEPPNPRMGLGFGRPDAFIGIRYRILPTEEVINVHLYRLKIRINNQEFTHHIAQLQPEGSLLLAYSIFGINHGGIQGSVTAWIEQMDPANPLIGSRVSEVSTLGRTTTMPQPSPPPLATASNAGLKFDRELPPAMKAAHEKSQQEMAEKKRPATDKELADLVKQLEHPTKNMRVKDLIEKLANTPEDPKYSKRVGKALESLYRRGSGFEKGAIFQALRVWNQEVLNELIVEGLEDDSFVVHGEALKAIDDPKDIPHLDRMLVDLSLKHGKEHEVEPILVRLGPSAEEETLRLLESREGGRAEMGLRVLARIGGKESLEQVEKLTIYGNGGQKREAENALRQIKRRIRS